MPDFWTSSQPQSSELRGADPIHAYCRHLTQLVTLSVTGAETLKDELTCTYQYRDYRRARFKRQTRTANGKIPHYANHERRSKRSLVELEPN